MAEILDFGDDSRIQVPKEPIELKTATMDYLEDTLWSTIKEYLANLGIKLVDEDDNPIAYEDAEPEFSVVKEVQEKILSILTESGVKFK